MTKRNEEAAIIPLLYRPEQAAMVLAVGRTKVYELIGAGLLRSVKIDGLRRIPVSALAEYVARLDAQEDAA